MTNFSFLRKWKNTLKKSIYASKWIRWVLLGTLIVGIVCLTAEKPVIAEKEQDFEKVQEEIPDELRNLYAQSAVLMDADTGRVFFGKNEEKIMPMASTTKIMTCILVLEETDLEEVAAVSTYAGKQPKVHLGVKEGEAYRVEDLLYSLMLESHNDSAVVLAEHVAGTVEDFAALMNQKAKEIGCYDTYFITPNGLDAEDETGVHSTTAADLARIMKYCIQDSPQREAFLRITGQKSHTFQDVSGTRSFTCNNHNAFLDMMEGALSGKTGFTADAGYCYVGALRQENEGYIVALLACGWPNNKGYKWSDTKKLMTYGLENYEVENVWKDVDLPEIPVSNTTNNGEKLKLYLSDVDKEIWVLKSENERVNVQIEVPKELEAPVKKDTKIGELIYEIEDIKLASFDIKSAEKVGKKTLWKLLVKMTKSWLIS